MNPFGSTIYVLGAILILAMVLIGYGTISGMPLAILIGAALGGGVIILGVIILVLYALLYTRFS